MTHSVRPATALKISALDFALLRGYLQGMDLRKLADQYLAEGVDLRVAKSRVKHIVEEIQLVARRRGNPAAARLATLHLPAVHAAASPSALPSLDEFRRIKDPDSFYTERELIELYREEFDGKIDRKVSRNARLRDKQVAALKWLEQLVVSPPVPADPVGAWLPDKWARPIAKAGYRTLGELACFINVRGYRWDETIPNIGVTGRTSTVSWLLKHGDELGITFTATALVPQRGLSHPALVAARGREVGIVPLENFVCPAALNGERGVNRAATRSPIFTADNDLDAIQAWLSRYQSSRHTYRAYRKEVERLMMWAIFARDKPLSSLDVADCDAYRAFLAHPEPAYQWVGQRGALRWSPAWRPFEGPLAPKSVASGLAVCRALFSWLKDMRYLELNPFTALADGVVMSVDDRRHHKRALLTQSVGSRKLSLDLWRWIETALQRLPASPANARLTFVLSFAQATGLRASELMDAQFADLTRETRVNDGESFYQLGVLGKGMKVRFIPLAASTVDTLKRYMASRYLPVDLAEPVIANGYLIGRLCGEEATLAARLAGVSYETVYKVVKDAFKQIALVAGDELDLADQARLKLVSTHWLRHCFGSHALAAGMGMEQVQQLLGHASMETTSIYASVERDALSVAVSKMAATVASR